MSGLKCLLKKSTVTESINNVTASARPLGFHYEAILLSRPAYGTRTIKLESDYEFVIPNVARTVVKCAIINQYMNHCKDVESTRSSRGHTEEIRFRGLENTRAVGADGFKDFL